MQNQKPAKIYVIEIKRVTYSSVAREQEMRGEKMQVTSTMLLKTNIEKMPEIGLSIMLQKNKRVIASSPLC